jgi:rhodanese-related sulfurtransferase
MCVQEQTWHDQYMIPGSPVFTLPEDVALLDVREDDEWTAGHAPQAVHVPMGQVSLRVKEIAASFPESPVYVVCRSGMRSAQITAYLLEIGLDAVNVEGGMESWVADGRPLVSETSAPPQVL